MPRVRFSQETSCLLYLGALFAAWRLQLQHDLGLATDGAKIQPVPAPDGQRLVIFENAVKNVTIRVLSGQDYGREIPVHTRKFVIGHAQDSDFIPGSSWVAPYHCELALAEDHVTIRPTDDKQDTFVNGERVVSERRLNSGDRVGVGWCWFEVRIDDTLAGP